MALIPAARALRVLGNGLSPICNSTTSLPAALRRLATARTSKAVSALRPRAKLLRVALVMVGRFGRETRRQGDRETRRPTPFTLLVSLSPCLLFGGDRL